MTLYPGFAGEQLMSVILSGDTRLEEPPLEAAIQAGERGSEQLDAEFLQQGSPPGRHKNETVPLGQLGTRPEEQRIPLEQNTVPLEEEEPLEEGPLTHLIVKSSPLHVPFPFGLQQAIIEFPAPTQATTPVPV